MLSKQNNMVQQIVASGQTVFEPSTLVPAISESWLFTL